MGCNVLSRVIRVKRLERGGCLFEGIVQKEMKEYMIQTRYLRIRLSSSVDNVSMSFTVDTARISMSIGKIFVIEDEEHVRRTVGLALKQGGYEVLEAVDGEEAMAAIQSSSIGFSAQAIICDVGLAKVN